MRTFHITITLADEETKLYAWCTGQSASAILEISPDEFYELNEVTKKKKKKNFCLVVRIKSIRVIIKCGSG